MTPTHNLAPLLFWLLPRSWGRGRTTRFRALTLTGCVDAVSGHGVFLHSLGAGGELGEAGHEGAQHQNEAKGRHLGVEREWWSDPGQGGAATLATPILLLQSQWVQKAQYFFKKAVPRANYPLSGEGGGGHSGLLRPLQGPPRQCWEKEGGSRAVITCWVEESGRKNGAGGGEGWGRGHSTTPDSQWEELRIGKPKVTPDHTGALLPDSRELSEGLGSAEAVCFQEGLEGGQAGHSFGFLEVCSATHSRKN